MPRTTWEALNHDILVVAVITPWGWKALIGVVPGKSHEAEWPHVRDYGDRLAENIARAIFPQFDGVKYDR